MEVEQTSFVPGPAVRFTSFSPARRPSAVPQPVYFANMALLHRRACLMVAESGGPGWKQALFTAIAGNPRHLCLILQLQKCGEEFQAASVMAAPGRCLVPPSPPGPPQH